MTGTPIELYVSLDLPPVTVRDAAMNVTRAVGEQEPRYANLALSAELNVPGRGHVSVPIDAKITNRPGRWEAAVRITAAKSENFFPTFDGTLSVTPDGGNNAELWLQGTYVPPGGVLGKGLDATIFRGLAEKSLRDFLNWFAAQVRDEVDRSERERADQARRFHG